MSDTPQTDVIVANLKATLNGKQAPIEVAGLVRHARRLESELADALEDAARYRWFRDECGLARQIEIVESAEGVSYMLEHHIDKGRCGL